MSDWTKTCPEHGVNDGELDMARIKSMGDFLYYIWHCGKGVDYVMGMVWMPPPELRDKYLRLVEALFEEGKG